MKTEEITKINELKSNITNCIRQESKNQFPMHFLYKDTLTAPLFKITVEIVEKDFFIDDRGIKWIREKI